MSRVSLCDDVHFGFVEDESEVPRVRVEIYVSAQLSITRAVCLVNFEGGHHELKRPCRFSLQRIWFN